MEEEKEKSAENWSYIASKWKKSVLSLKEYLLTDSNEQASQSFSYASLNLPSQDYSNANQLREKLLQQYQGKVCSEIFPGEVCENAYGKCYHITTRVPLFSSSFKQEKCQDLLNHLELLPGIGPITRQKLVEEGYCKISDLCSHPRYQTLASSFMDHFQQASLENLYQWLGTRFKRSHPAWLKLLAMAPPDDWAFVDIETLGLFSRPIILIGAGIVENHELVIHQWLVRQIEEEASALMEYYQVVQKTKFLITYNGQRFDIPYINDRWAYYGIRSHLNFYSLDMLYPSRSVWKQSLPDCKLQTIEQAILHKQRSEDVPGALVPEFYQSYLQSSNLGPLVPIVSHNQVDIASLAELSLLLYER